MNLATSWRPTEVNLAPWLGQTSTPPAAPKSSLIDSALFATLFDAAIAAGAGVIAVTKRNESKDEPNDKKKARFINTSYFFWGVSVLAGVKLILDGSRVGR